MTYRAFDRSRLAVLPLSERQHDLDLAAIRPLTPVQITHNSLAETGRRIRRARERNAAVILMLGAHVLRAGLQRYLIDWMERGLVTAIATNGATAIHDYEWARIGATTESVARYIKDGRFGLWKETGEINDVVSNGAKQSMGLGECIGKAIEDGAFPHRDISVFAAAYRLRVPLTVHVGVGSDIVHEHPNCDGASYGSTSYLDFLRLTAQFESLEHGVVMNFGSAVMAPEVYLKALAMVRNVARQEGREICHFTTLVCDLHTLPQDFKTEAPRGSAAYYFRPWKTMLVRTVAEGGESFYVCGNHAETMPQLWTATTQ